MNFFALYSEYITTALFCVTALGLVWYKAHAFLWTQRRVIFAMGVVAVVWTAFTDPFIHIHGVWVYDPVQNPLSQNRFLFVPVFEYVYIFFVGITISSGFLALQYRLLGRRVPDVLK